MSESEFSSWFGHLEWEPFRTSQEFQLDEDNPLGSVFGSISIERDNDLIINGKAILLSNYEHFNTSFDRNRENIPGGNYVPPLFQASNDTYTLTSRLWIPGAHETQFGEFDKHSRPCKLYSLTLERHGGGEPYWCRIFCVNGPKRAGYTHFEKKYIDVQQSRKNIFLENFMAKGSILKYKKAISIPSPIGFGKASLGPVSTELISEKYRPVSIEFFCFGFEGEISVPFVRKYLDAISFCFGRRIIPLCISFFDIENKPIKHFAESPLDLNFQLHPQDRPPVTIETPPGCWDEDLINDLINTFLSTSERLDLSSPYYGLWLAQCLSDSYFSIPILASTLEDLARQNSNKKTKPPFKTFDIPFGNLEEKAWIRRHHVVHGLPEGKKKKEGLLMSRNLNTELLLILKTLVHRSFLYSIGWKQTYRDYYTPGWPSRPMSEPIGGSEGQ